MGNYRDGLKAYSYKNPVGIRLEEANKKPIINNADYRFVNLGEEIFPIHIDIVNAYYSSSRRFKRGMKKSFIKMLKKHNKNNIKKFKMQHNEI